MKLSWCVVLFAALCAPYAYGGFYVDETVPMASMTIASAKPVAELSIKVPFFKNRTTIGPAAARLLQRNVDEFRNSDGLVVTSYAVPLEDPDIPRARANAVRVWLIANGVSEHKVTFINDIGSPRTNDAGLTIAVIRRRPEVVPLPRQTLNASTVAGATSSPTSNVTQENPVKPGSMTDQMKLSLAQRIVGLAQNKTVTTDAAINILADVLKMRDGAPPPTIVAAPVPTMPAAILEELPRTWTLDSKRSLQANIEEWGKTAGWNSVSWESNNAYQVNYTSTYSGTFFDVLNEVAAIVSALDFRISKTQRALTVVDRRP